MHDNNTNTAIGDKWKRLYLLQVQDGNEKALGKWSFHSLSSLIEWAKQARLKRVVEIEEEL